MKRTLSSVLALFLVVCAILPVLPFGTITSGITANAATADYKYVAIIGVDGAGNFFQNADTPNMDRLFADGAVTHNMLTSNPTISAQSWGSLLHGVTPEYHRLTNAIVSSVAYPANSAFPSVFRVIRENDPNAVLASFSHWKPINTGIIEDGIGVHKVGGLSDAATTTAICDYLKTSTPNLLFVQFDEADGAGHSSGYNTETQWTKLTEIDGYIGDIYAAYEAKGILDETLFIVTADHGGNGMSHGGLTDAEKYVTFAAVGHTVQKGTIGDMEIRDTAAVVTYALGYSNPAGWTARVPSGLFKGVTAGERPVYVSPVVDREHETVPTPHKTDKGYIGNYISEDKIETYLTFDGDITDSMGAKTVRNGKLYFTEGYFGQCVSLDDGYVTLPDHDPGTESFTLSFWLNTQGVSGDPVIIGNENWNRGTNPGYVIAIDAKQVIFNLGSGSGRAKYTYPLPDNAFDGWMHLLLVIDRENGTVGFSYDFGDMIVDALPSSMKNTSFSCEYPVNIGQDGTGSYGRKLSGAFDELMIFKGALSEAEIKNLSHYYSGVATTPAKGSEGYITNYVTDKTLVNYLTFDGSDADDMGNDTATYGEVTYIDGVLGQGVTVGKGYVSILDHDPGTESFTVSFWMKTPGVSSDPAIFSNKNWKSGRNNGYIFALNSGDNNIFNVGNGSATYKGYTALTDYKDTWTHVTVVVDREANCVKVAYNFGSFYVNKLSDAMKGVSFSTDYPLNIGQDGTGSYSATFSGVIDEFMVFEGALDRTDVRALYEYYGYMDDSCRDYESKPTPENGTEGHVSNFVTDKALINYLPFDGNVSDECGTDTAENGSLKYTDGVYGQGVMLDDGYVSLLGGISGTESFTVSLWIQTMGANDNGGWSDPPLFSNANWAQGASVGVTFAFNPVVYGRANAGNGNVRAQLRYDMPADYAQGWVHCILVIDREKNEMKIAYDFGAFATVKLDESFIGALLDSGLPLNIGQDGTGAYSQKLQATVDEFMIFEGALDRYDVSALAEYYGIDIGEVVDHRAHESTATPKKGSEGFVTEFVTDKDLALYLPLDGSAENIFGDNATAENGTVVYDDGFLGQGATFNNGYISVEGMNFGNGDFTVALWMKTDGVSNDPLLFSNKDWNSGRNTGFALGINDKHEIDFNLGYDRNRFDSEHLLPVDYQAGWTHIVFTVDRAAMQVRIAFDFGEFVVIDISEIGNAAFDGLAVFNIGQDGTGAYPRVLTATLDEFMVFNGAFDQNDLADLAAYYGIDMANGGHVAYDKWESDENSHYKTCANGCGEKLEYAEHNYENATDTDCDTCGYVREVAATEGQVSTKIFWSFEDGVLSITGRGKIKNFSGGVTPWSHLADQITKVIIGEGITYIGSSAFYYCASIESVELPESLTAMGNYVFYGCSSLKTITIPEAVNEIGKYSFRRSGIETINFGIGYGWSAGDREFSIADIISGGWRFISKSYYKQTWVRNTEASEETLDPGYVAGGIMHTDVIWELTYTDESKTNMKLTIRGNGAMADFGTAGAPWYAYWEQITEIEIQDGVTYVGRCAFYGLKFVRKVTVPTTVTAIGDYGFYMCRLMKEITLPEGITIGTDAFVKTGVAL